MNMKTSSKAIIGVGALLTIIAVSLIIFGRSKSVDSDTSKTPLPGKVYNLIILDESGSMSSVYKADS